jgi:hypothetical protein
MRAERAGVRVALRSPDRSGSFRARGAAAASRRAGRAGGRARPAETECAHPVPRAGGPCPSRSAATTPVRNSRGRVTLSGSPEASSCAVTIISTTPSRVRVKTASACSYGSTGRVSWIASPLRSSQVPRAANRSSTMGSNSPWPAGPMPMSNCRCGRRCGRDCRPACPRS